jgi:hypothetical protein
MDYNYILFFSVEGPSVKHNCSHKCQVFNDVKKSNLEID